MGRYRSSASPPISKILLQKQPHNPTVTKTTTKSKSNSNSNSNSKTNQEFQQFPASSFIDTDIAWFAAVATCIKLLLIPSYRSTDFEVHRHWLALTHSLPLPHWYYDETSPWTLDYPPFFAYFERLLSVFARLLDPTIVDLHLGINYSSRSVLLFQRLSVATADLSLFYAAHHLTRRLDPIRRRIALALVVWSPALLIVDHVHFQYNGFLIGILLISLSFLEEGRDLIGGFAFAVLLCFKHLFAVAAPVYFVYLLRHYCRGGFWRRLWRFSAMGAVVGVVFLAAFGPFVYYNQVISIDTYMIPSVLVWLCFHILLFGLAIELIWKLN